MTPGSGVAPLRILVAGASGMIGTELRAQLAADGHSVVQLVRRPTISAAEVSWSPSTGTLDPAVVDGVDAVINLSGAPTIHVPWTKRYKRELRSSRLDSTRTLVSAITLATSPPSVLINASAVGFYGDRPGEVLTEDSPKGTGFLSDLAAEWEQAAMAAPKATRVAVLRTGLVVGEGDGFRLLGLFAKTGLAFRVGPGTDVWPWISLRDEAAAIRHILGSELSGPVNLSGPTPATGDQVTRALAMTLHRWRPWVVPEWLVRLVLREPGRELILQDQRMIPRTLLDDGFIFLDETIEQAMQNIWG